MTYIVALVSSYELAFMRIGWSQPSRRQRVRSKLVLLGTLHVRLGMAHSFAGMPPRKLGEATPVLDAFHVVKLAGQALDEVRRPVQQDTLGHRGHAGDPLYRIRNILRAGAHRLTDKQWDRLVDCLGRGDPDGEVLLTWQCYQQVRSAYATTDLATGKKIAEKVVATFSSCPIGEIARLGRTLRQWKHTYLGYFTTGRSNNGGTEINGIVELHRRIARGFRNRDNYRLRMLLVAGGLDPRPLPEVR